jgi:tetratricopeptide (TPR) repeat protein
MPADSLYCQQCGEDIHIVPDFDSELDYQMQQVWIDALQDSEAEAESEAEDAQVSIHQTPTEVIGNDNRHYKSKGESYPKKYGSRHKSGILKVVLWSLFAAFAFGLGVTVVFLYQYTSFDYQVRQGSKDVEAMRYQDAIGHFSRALELEKDNQDLRFSLANVYLQQGNKVEYEYQLRKILEDPSATSEDLESAYLKLIKIYQSREDYQTINALIKASESQVIQETYQNYIANPPEFSYPEGDYTEIIPLKLMTSTKGNIYYTMDGSEPDLDSDVYDSPIFLDDGDYTIKACFQNQYGIMSDTVTRQYHITIEQPASPEVDVESGYYTQPMWIQVLNTWEGDVYYTTDGSVPDRNDQLYTHPIPMPMGDSQFQFALIGEDGRIGAITDREYRLTLETSITPEDAARIIASAMQQLRTEEDIVYQYHVMYAAPLNGQGDYYVIAESDSDAQGNLLRTGSYFAVDIYQGIGYKLQITDGQYYTFSDIISQAVPSQEENIN